MDKRVIKKLNPALDKTHISENIEQLDDNKISLPATRKSSPPVEARELSESELEKPLEEPYSEQDQDDYSDQACGFDANKMAECAKNTIEAYKKESSYAKKDAILNAADILSEVGETTESMIIRHAREHARVLQNNREEDLSYLRRMAALVPNSSADLKAFTDHVNKKYDKLGKGFEDKQEQFKSECDLKIAKHITGLNVIEAKKQVEFQSSIQDLMNREQESTGDLENKEQESTVDLENKEQESTDDLENKQESTVDWRTNRKVLLTGEQTGKYC